VADEGELIQGRYRLVARIGSGGMGVVWRARDTTLNRDVAIKELLVKAGMTEEQTQDAHHRAMREARIAARLHHPNAVAVYDVIEYDGRPCPVMEFVPSQSLSALLSGGGRLSPERVARMGGQIADALAAAHDAGIVHRDVKPGNVLLADRDGAAKLSDFGISRAVGDSTVTATGVLVGTPAFLAPEVARGEPATWRSDVFSLGSTLYAALEGGPPFGFDGQPITLLLRVATAEIPPPRHAGPLAGPLLSMLRADPAARPTAREIAQTLAALADRLPASPPAAREQAEQASLAALAALAGQASPPAEPEAASRPADPPPSRRTWRATDRPQSEDTPAALADRATTPETTSPAGSSDGSSASDHRPAITELPGRADTDSAPAVPSAASSANAPAGRRRRWVVAGTAAAAVVVAAGVSTAVLLGSGSSPGPSHAATSRPTAAAPGTSARHTGGTTGAPASTSTAPPSITAQLTSAIVDYYQLMPTHLDQGWSHMTADYQQNHAGGMSGYTSFWQQIRHVTASDVTATPPSTVVATIDYTYKNGQVVKERTSFGLVQQDGMWKIAGSAVLSPG
jgi:eukaryotic-like serine/threonine-protein kinase